VKEYLFKSERLGFRNWQEKDVSKMIAISADEEVMEFFPATAKPEETIAFIGKMKLELENFGYCYFAVDLLETKEFIGFIGLLNQNYTAPFTPCIDIGWRLAKNHWSNGYATEGAQSCLTYAFEKLQIKEIVATAPAINTKSIQVMKKIGMKKKLSFKHPKLINHPHLEECVCYSISNLSV